MALRIRLLTCAVPLETGSVLVGPALPTGRHTRGDNSCNCPLRGQPWTHRAVHATPHPVPLKAIAPSCNFHFRQHSLKCFINPPRPRGCAVITTHAPQSYPFLPTSSPWTAQFRLCCDYYPCTPELSVFTNVIPLDCTVSSNARPRRGS